MTPISLRLDAGALHVEWPDASPVEGSVPVAALGAALSAGLLREHCRCAECQRVVRLGGVLVAAPDLRLTDALPVGGYGVQLHFSDGHDRGIYPWPYLRELAGEVAAN